ncbi:MAG TPA: EAL domain-containing protein [Firmicutes bacterium]|nr:EAL domain-containing protein [Bacillota bacterium]
MSQVDASPVTNKRTHFITITLCVVVVFAYVMGLYSGQKVTWQATMLLLVSCFIFFIAHLRYRSLLRLLTKQYALEDTYLRLQDILDAVPDALVLIDKSGLIIEANQALSTLTGYEKNELFGMHVAALSPERMRRSLPNLLANPGKGGMISWYCQRKDGGRVLVEIGYHAITVKNMECLLLSVRDLTSREQAEKKLRASETRFRSLFENSLDGIYRSTPEGYYVDVNPALVRMLGYDSKEELLSIHIPKDLYVSQADRLPPDQRNTVSTTRMRRKDGTELWVELTTWVVCNEDGEVVYYEGITRDVTEQKRYEETIRHQAYHDALTGLPNRYLLHDRLNQTLAQARRNKTLIGVMFLDLDHFKNINDTLGHTVGDQLLQMVAGRLLSCIREGDTVARLGGDEFTLVAQIAQPEDALQIAQRIHEVLKRPFPLEGHELHITTSIGISIFPHDADDADTLLKNADTALYRSKAQGRNNHQLYDPTMNASAMSHLMLLKGLRYALGLDEFELFYQPITDTASGQIVAAEALLRWKKPGVGYMKPDEFIPLAEESGLIVPIGEWVLRTACAQAQRWHEQLGRYITISVNLAASQFMPQNLIQTVKKVLKETQLNPNLLLLEITEGTALQNLNATCSTLDQLVSLGVRIAIDDFGTGYSSMSLVKRLPLQTLKIDKSFVKNVASNHDDAAIVSSIISMAHSLRLRVVAEGVETEEQAEYLRTHDCDAIQGYLISPPIPAEEFTKLLQDPNTRTVCSHSVEA